MASLFAVAFAAIASMDAVAAASGKNVCSDDPSSPGCDQNDAEERGSEVESLLQTSRNHKGLGLGQERVEHRQTLGRSRNAFDNAENATQEKPKKGNKGGKGTHRRRACNVFHFTASYNGNEYAADCTGDYVNLGSRWECADNVNSTLGEMKEGVANCASDAVYYEHIPRDVWYYNDVWAYGKPAEWVDKCNHNQSFEKCRSPNINFVVCTLYAKLGGNQLCDE